MTRITIIDSLSRVKALDSRLSTRFIRCELLENGGLAAVTLASSPEDVCAKFSVVLTGVKRGCLSKVSEEIIIIEVKWIIIFVIYEL